MGKIFVENIFRYDEWGKKLVSERYKVGFSWVNLNNYLFPCEIKQEAILLSGYRGIN
jgi:hypothetical protein